MSSIVFTPRGFAEHGPAPAAYRQRARAISAVAHDSLSPHHRYVAELRNPTWYDDAVYALLRERDIAVSARPARKHRAARGDGPVRTYAGSYPRLRLVLHDLAAQLAEMSSH